MIDKADKLAALGGKPACSVDWPAWPQWDLSDEHSVLAALKSGGWGLCPEPNPVSRFIEQFTEAHHAKHGLCCCNGTVALMIALRAAGVLPGHEVIMPAYTFMATATAAIGIGATPIMVDVDRDTLNLDPAAAEAAITDRTAALLPVHLAGMPADMDALLAIAHKHNIAVVEDAAQAHFAEYNGVRVGALGDSGSFSFQSSKNLTAGEGGFVTTNQPEVYRIAHAFHHCGRDPAVGEWYAHPFMGQNLRLPQLQAALLLSQMARLPEQHKKRTGNGRYLAEKLSAIDGIRVSGWPWPEKVTAASYHIFIFFMDPEKFGGVDNRKFSQALRAEGVFCHGGYNKSMQDQELFDDPFVHQMLGSDHPDFKAMDTPVSRHAIRHCIWIKQNQLLSERSVMDKIVHAVQKLRDNAEHLPEVKV
ncbi:MAG: DegT/DnrJ/EryC1/StrS family aminotransferase [Planctomycetota bacterium]